MSLFVRANPLTQFVTAMRNSVYDLRAPSAGRMGFLFVVSVASVLCGWVIFRRFSARVSEEL